MENYRDVIYKSYISIGFGESHTSEKSYRIQKKYFKKNYLRRGIFAQKKGPFKICELGCGCGEFMRFLSESEYILGGGIGIDGSPENIERCQNMGIKNVRFIHDNILHFLDNTDEQFDVFVFNDVIEHLTKNEIVFVLRKMYELLKDGGCIYIKTPNMANPYVAAAGRYIAFDHEIGFTDWSMREVLRAVGFKDIQIYGTDIYVLNPIISLPAKLLAKLINLKLRFLSALYGRTSIRIFEKDILAVVKK